MERKQMKNNNFEKFIERMIYDWKLDFDNICKICKIQKVTDDRIGAWNNKSWTYKPTQNRI